MASLHKARDQGEIDMEAWEEAIRNAVLRYGANLLEGLLAKAGCGRRNAPVLDADGQPMHRIGVRQKPLTTLLGTVTMRCSVFKDATGTRTRIPLEESPGVTVTSFSPATVPILYVSFDGTGVPMRKSELHSSKGKGPDGKARTREVKLGCIFTQTTTDEAGWPVRDPDSTTYGGAIDSSELFGLRIYQEAVRRGSEQAHKIVVLTDGARYNKTIASTHFPGAVHIIDLYHAREHLAGLAKTIGIDDAQLSAWRDLLDMGRVENILDQANSHIDALSLGNAQADILRKDLGYFQENARLMRYAEFRIAGYFVGSGVVEAGCRTLIGERLKRSGMFWSLRGANAIIASRCCQISGRFEDFWEDAA